MSTQENQDTQAADAAAAKEAAQAAAARGEQTDADRQVARDQALDEARAKAADAAKVAAQAKAKEEPVKGATAKDKGVVADDAAEAPVFAAPSAEDRTWATETYGPQIATAMDKAGVNPTAANAYWQEHGKLPEKAFEKLEAAGYPRTMVNAYLSGVTATADKAAKAGDEFASEVTKIAGSAKAWDQMTAWASQGGMPAAEITDFNAVIDSKNVGAMRIAAKALKARFEQVNGKLPKVNINGPAGGGDGEGNDEAARGDVFKTTVEIVAAQRDVRYQKDPTYRREVEQKVARSNLFGKARRASR